MRPIVRSLLCAALPVLLIGCAVPDRPEPRDPNRPPVSRPGVYNQQTLGSIAGLAVVVGGLAMAGGGGGPDPSPSLRWSAAPPPSLSPTAAGRVELPAAVGGKHPYTYTLLCKPALPDFTTWAPATRTLIWGSPTADSFHSCAYSARDSSDPPLSHPSAAKIDVTFAKPRTPTSVLRWEASPPPRIESSASGQRRLPAAVGGRAPYTYSLRCAPDLPETVTWSAATRTILWNHPAADTRHSCRYDATDSSQPKLSVPGETFVDLVFTKPLTPPSVLRWSGPVPRRIESSVPGDRRLPGAAGGRPPYKYSLSCNPPLPDEVTWSAPTRTLLWSRPTAASSHSCRYGVTDSSEPPLSHPGETVVHLVFTKPTVVPAPLEFVSGELSRGSLNLGPSGGERRLAAAKGGTAPYTYSLVCAPDLPSSVAWSAATRTLVWDAPEEASRHSCRYRATDSSDPVRETDPDNILSLRVTPRGPVVPPTPTLIWENPAALQSPIRLRTSTVPGARSLPLALLRDAAPDANVTYDLACIAPEMTRLGLSFTQAPPALSWDALPASGQLTCLYSASADGAVTLVDDVVVEITTIPAVGHAAFESWLYPELSFPVGVALPTEGSDPSVRLPRLLDSNGAVIESSRVRYTILSPTLPSGVRLDQPPDDDGYPHLEGTPESSTGPTLYRLSAEPVDPDGPDGPESAGWSGRPDPYVWKMLTPQIVVPRFGLGSGQHEVSTTWTWTATPPSGSALVRQLPLPVPAAFPSSGWATPAYWVQSDSISRTVPPASACPVAPLHRFLLAATAGPGRPQPQLCVPFDTTPPPGWFVYGVGPGLPSSADQPPTVALCLSFRAERVHGQPRTATSPATPSRYTVTARFNDAYRSGNDGTFICRPTPTGDEPQPAVFRQDPRSSNAVHDTLLPEHARAALRAPLDLIRARVARDPDPAAGWHPVADVSYRSLRGAHNGFDWSGSSQAVTIGTEAVPGNRWRFGALLSVAETSIDYRALRERSSSDGYTSGDHDTTIVTATPYASAHLRGGSTVWGAATLGTGRLSYRDRGEESAYRKELSADLTLAGAALGTHVPLLADRLAVEGLFQASRLASSGAADPDGAGDLAGMAARTVHTRDADARFVYTPPDWHGWSPEARLGVRWFGGDGQTGKEGVVGIGIASPAFLGGRATLAGDVELADGMEDARSSRFRIEGRLQPGVGGAGLTASYGVSAVTEEDVLPWQAMVGYGRHSAFAGAVVRPFVRFGGGSGSGIWRTYGVERQMGRPGDRLAVETTQRDDDTLSRAVLQVGF